MTVRQERIGALLLGELFIRNLVFFKKCEGPFHFDNSKIKLV